MNTLLIQIYQSANAKYVKFKRRLDKNIARGQFRHFTRRKQKQLINKIERLRRRLLQLQTQLKLASAGAAFSLFLNAGSVEAQTSLGPFTRNYPDNPLPPPLPMIQKAAPVYVDIDADGDQDLVVGEQNNQIHFFKNLGTNTKAFFLEIDANDPENPFKDIASALPFSKRHFVPAFVDVDGDADLDMLLGTDDKYGTSGELFFFRNEGNEYGPPNFVLDEATNPFVDDYGIKFSTLRYAHPTFADVDNDGDQDLWLGGYYDTSTYSYLLQYFENVGTSSAPQFVKNTTHSLVDSYVVNNLYDNYGAAPIQFADLDKDGDLDFFMGYYDRIIYLRNDGGSFSSEYDQPNQTGPWIPSSRLGNPFDQINEDNSGNDLKFSTADLDNDGDLDVTVAIDYFNYDYNGRTFFYYKNVGTAVLELKEGLESPVDGIDQGEKSNASFVDIDKDGDLDVFASGSIITTYCPDGCYAVTLTYSSLFKNESGKFVDITGTSEDIFSGLLFEAGAKSKLIDVNSDGLLDVVAPFSEVTDYGVIISNHVQYFENVAGVLTERTGSANPFDFVDTPFQGNINLDIGDLDGDGLVDLILGVGDQKLQAFKNTGTQAQPIFIPKPEWETGFLEYVYYNSSPRLIDIDNDSDLDIILGKYSFIWYYENKGTPTNPSFVQYDDNNINNPFKGVDLYYPSPGFFDVDGDGDKDMIGGDEFGQFVYYENNNPAPITNAKAALNYDQGTAPVILDAAITLSDSDNDLIASAVIAIKNFRPGDEILSYSQQAGMELITGSFSTTTGLLKLTGIAPISVYQNVLRTVSYRFVGTPPTTSGRTSAGRSKSVTLDRSITFTTFDQDFTAPVPLTLALQISFPDPNQPPVISPPAAIVGIGNKIDIDFSALISDPNFNLDAASFRVVKNPTSGASYSITGLVVQLDYTGNAFTGQDQFTVEICDLAGACTTSIISVNVEGDIIVYNGFSPNGDVSNPYFEIGNITLLEPQNKVSIFNRWGDRVFEVDNYDNATRRFDGKNNNGNELPSGVYFYRIEFTSGREELSGYLTIKK